MEPFCLFLLIMFFNSRPKFKFYYKKYKITCLQDHYNHIASYPNNTEALQLQDIPVGLHSSRTFFSKLAGMRN